MYKKIMIAVDGSETAKKALQEAQNIANNYNADLCIVHCIKGEEEADRIEGNKVCLLYTSPSPRDRTRSRMPSSA